MLGMAAHVFAQIRSIGDALLDEPKGFLSAHHHHNCCHHGRHQYRHDHEV
jgi:hypothetical protein